MGYRTIGILLIREAKDFFRNKTLIIISILGLVLFLSIYFIIPDKTEDEVFLAVYMESENHVLNNFLMEKEIPYEPYYNFELFEADLKNNQYPAGLAITDDIWEQLKSGVEIDIPFYIASDTAEEYVEVLQAYLEIYLNEMLLVMQKSPIPLKVEDITVGIDSLTNEVPLKRIFIPLIIIMIYITELLGFGNSLMEEIESRTIVAIMVTPVKLGDFLLSKSLMGVFLIFLQSLIVIFVTGSVNNKFFYIVILLLMSAFLIAGLSFLLASISRDLMTLVSWGLLVMILIIIPVFAVLFPGLQSAWIRYIPSYIMADSLNGLINLNRSWSEIGQNILIICLFSIFFFSIGLYSLKRRIECL